MNQKLTRRGFLVAVVLIGVCAANSQARAAKPNDEVQVLFIGNSLTYVNDLPKMLAELAEAGRQPPLRYDQQTPGGCTLEKHWKDGRPGENPVS